MASSTLMKYLEENFFLCSVCLAQFKEPKQLPCLHRYCKDCLESLIQSSQDGNIKCPMCKEEYVIPENGADGFKTEFHLNSMIEVIEVHKLQEKKELQTCIDCSKKTSVTAYCFKCKSCLCAPCYQRHLNNPMFNDHQTYILNMENTEVKNLTLERLATFMQDPRCPTHMNQSVQVCCSTCQNVPVCMACVYGKHKGHDIHDVTEIAKNERKSLQLILDELKLYEFPEKVKTAKPNVNDNLSKEIEKLRIQYKEQVNKIEANLEINNAKQDKHDKDIKYRRHDEENKIASKREAEINRIKNKYDKILKTMKETNDKESIQVKKEHDDIKKQLCLDLDILRSNLKSMTIAHELLAKQNDKDLQTLLVHCKQIIKRYENFTEIVSSILASKDDWTYAQCIPDIRVASEPLITEIKKIFVELESLSDSNVGGINDVTILKESVIDMAGIGIGMMIDGITSIRDGSIVLTGRTLLDNKLHTKVINRQWKIQREDTMVEYIFPQYYCCFLSEFKVAIAFCGAFPTYNVIGIYDDSCGSHKKINISDIIKRDQYVTCIATDSVNQIIVGTNSGYVYVFDDQLKYTHIITLPNMISFSSDMTVHGRNLLVCDHTGKRAFAFTVTSESKFELLHVFTKPDLDEYEWAPLSVCTDKNGFIFMLLTAPIARQVSCVLVQYDKDGRQLLTRQVDKDSGCVTILQTDEADKLMISTKTSNKLYIYTVCDDLYPLEAK